MRVTSGSWDGEKVFSRDQVLEVRNVDGRLHIARKPRHHDEWDLPIAPYDPTGRASMSSLMTESVIDQAGPALHVTADRDRSCRPRKTTCGIYRAFCFMFFGGGSGGNQAQLSGPQASVSMRAAITKSDS